MLRDVDEPVFLQPGRNDISLDEPGLDPVAHGRGDYSVTSANLADDGAAVSVPVSFEPITVTSQQSWDVTDLSSVTVSAHDDDGNGKDDRLRHVSGHTTTRADYHIQAEVSLDDGTLWQASTAR